MIAALLKDHQPVDIIARSESRLSLLFPEGPLDHLVHFRTFAVNAGHGTSPGIENLDPPSDEFTGHGRLEDDRRRAPAFMKDNPWRLCSAIQIEPGKGHLLLAHSNPPASQITLNTNSARQAPLHVRLAELIDHLSPILLHHLDQQRSSQLSLDLVLESALDIHLDPFSINENRLGLRRQGGHRCRLEYIDLGLQKGEFDPPVHGPGATVDIRYQWARITKTGDREPFGVNAMLADQILPHDGSLFPGLEQAIKLGPLVIGMNAYGEGKLRIILQEQRHILQLAPQIPPQPDSAIKQPAFYQLDNGRRLLVKVFAMGHPKYLGRTNAVSHAGISNGELRQIPGA